MLGNQHFLFLAELRPPSWTLALGFALLVWLARAAEPGTAPAVPPPQTVPPPPEIMLDGKPVPRSWPLSKAELAKLEAGELLIQDESFLDPADMPVGKVVSYVLLKASIQALAKAIFEPTDQPQYMPRLTSVEVLSTEGRRKRIRYKLKIVIVDIEYVLFLTRLVEEPEFAVFSWGLDKTYAKNDIRESIGSWVLRRYDATRTLVQYSLYVDTGRVVPEFVQTFLMKQDLPDVLGNLRKRLESGGTWKK